MTKKTLAYATLLLILVAPLFAGERLVGPETEDSRATISLVYYGEIGCSHCDTFLSRTLPDIAETRNVSFRVATHDIMNPDLYEQCRDELADRGRGFRTFPVLFVGNNAYQGSEAVAQGLSAEIDHYLSEERFRPQVPQALDGSVSSQGPERFVGERLALLPIVLAGAADGLNPCAFVTLLFLLSLLTLLGKSSREVLLIGLLFAATVFGTYLALGFGMLNLLRAAVRFDLLRLIFRLAFSLGALVFGVLAIRDAVLLKEGRSSEALLQLSAENKKRIHAVLRDRFRRQGLFLGTIVAAFLVSIMELACTGQLYLPTIAYLVQTGATLPAEIGALLLYNLAFVAPLLILFFLVYTGVSSKRISRWFERHAAESRAVTALAFLVLAGAIWLV